MMKSNGFVKLLVLSMATLAIVPAFAQDGKVNVQPENQKVTAEQSGLIPAENIDGSEVSADTQAAAIKIVDTYKQAESAGDSAAMAQAITDLEALKAKDGKNLAVLTWLGYMHMAGGDYAKAMSNLELVRGKSTSDAINISNLRNLAFCYYLTQDYTNAASALTELDKLQPNQANTLAVLGSSYVLSKRYAEAIDPLTKAKKLLGPGESRSVALDLALAYQETKRTQDLLNLFDEMKSDENLTSDQLGWMGYVYLNNGRVPTAIEVLSRAYELDSGNLSVINNLANAYSQRNSSGDKDKALEMLVQLVELAPGNATAAYNAGTIYLSKNDYENAKKYFLISLENSNDPFVHNNLGRAHEGLGDWDSAAKSYTAASDMAKDNAMFAANAGTAHQKVGNTATAAMYFERAIEAGNTDPMITLNLANALNTAGETEKAYELLTEKSFQTKMSGDADYWFNLGVIASDLGKTNEARDAYQKCLDIRPDDASALNNLGVILFNQKDYQGALGYFNKLDAKNPGQAQTQLNIAACYAQMGNYESAVKIWRDMVRKSPDDLDLRLNLADALWNIGDTAGARFHYADALKRDSNNSRALNGLGLWALLQNETTEAESYFRRSVRADRTFMQGYVNLAISLERLNRVAEAKAVLKAALAMNSEYKEAQDMLTRLNSSG